MIQCLCAGLFSSRVPDAVPESQAWCNFLAIYYCYHHRGESRTSPVLVVSLIKNSIGYRFYSFVMEGVWRMARIFGVRPFHNCLDQAVSFVYMQ